MVCHHLTIDLEDRFSAPILAARGLSCESEEGVFYSETKETLDFLDDLDINSTFFVVASQMKKHPQLLGEIRDRGHEVACHGLDHRVLSRFKSGEEFRGMLSECKKILGKVKGYRAPMFTLNQGTGWAIDALIEEGFKYDSSVFPVWTPEYQNLKAPNQPYQISSIDINQESDSGFWEYPLLTLNVGPIRIPAAGGFYMRVLPAAVMKKALNDAEKKQVPATLYMHNWELAETPAKKNFGRYCNTILHHNTGRRLKNKIKKIIKKHEFGKIEDKIL